MSFTKDCVSIVTPVYNGAGFLDRMLNSVLEQSWNNVEMILVDDGSTDNTVQLASGYSERFVERGYSFRVVCAKHSCAAGAVSEGLKYVTGEFLIWPDSDDVLEPESIERRVSFLQANPQFNVVRSLSRYVNESDGSEASRDERIGDISKTQLFFDILESATFVCCGCYMVRSETFFALYPKRNIPVYNVGQNFQMLLPICYHNEVATIEDVLYVVYKRDASHSRRVLSREDEETKYADYESLLDDIVEIADITNFDDLRRIEAWKYKRRYNLARKYHNSKGMNHAAKALYKIGAADFKKYVRMRLATLMGGNVQKVYRKVRGILRKSSGR